MVTLPEYTGSNLRTANENSNIIVHQPYPNVGKSHSTLSIDDYEKLLSEWFGTEVVLLSSGRAGIILYFQALGLNRYNSFVEIPRYISPCVIDVVVQYAYPVQQGTDNSVSILYHQYGYPQKYLPNGHVLEDICHRFFEKPMTGSRNWIGDVGVFSLPKFFGTAGTVGGLTTNNTELAMTIRHLRDSCQLPPPGTRDWIRSIYQKKRNNPEAKSLIPYLKAAYSLIEEYVQPDLNDLAGFPTSLEEIQSIGEKRLNRIDRLVDGLGNNSIPVSFSDNIRNWLPFAYAFFGSGNKVNLSDADRTLREAGICAGIYQVDINRNISAPDYQPCLLLPCHQDVPMKKIDVIIDIIKQHSS